MRQEVQAFGGKLIELAKGCITNQKRPYDVVPLIACACDLSCSLPLPSPLLPTLPLSFASSLYLFLLVQPLRIAPEDGDETMLHAA